MKTGPGSAPAGGIPTVITWAEQQPSASKTEQQALRKRGAMSSAFLSYWNEMMESLLTEVLETETADSNMDSNGAAERKNFHLCFREHFLCLMVERLS